MSAGLRDRIDAEGKEAQVNQATKWDWKRLAARLLLVPVLAGGPAALAHAQTRAPAAPARAAAATPAPAAAGSDKAMLKDGRKALAEGRYNDARDLAQRAEASNPSGKWGLFEDTPNALRQDIEAAKTKAQKAEAEQLFKQARGMFNKAQAKGIATDASGSQAERAANLDTALQLARRADQLHGSYTAWDLGDRPDRLVKEIEDARAKLRALPPAPVATAPVKPAVALAPPVKPAVATAPAAPAAATPNTLPTWARPVASLFSRPAQPPATTAAATAVKPAVAVRPVGSPSGVVTAAATGKPGPVTPAAATTPLAATPPAKPLTPVAVVPPPATPVAVVPPPAAPVAVLPPPAAPVAVMPLPAAPVAVLPPPAAPVAVETDPKRAAALKLMAEGKSLVDGGDFVGAHAKYAEADKLGAAFGDREYGPGLALQELNARGVASIDRLLKEAHGQMAKRDFPKADAALAAAGEIAGVLNLFPRPIEEAKTALRVASAGTFGGPAPVEPVPEPDPVEPTKPDPVVVAKAVEPAMPVVPPKPEPVVVAKRVELVKPATAVGVPILPPTVASAGETLKPIGAITGRQLMDQAALEYRKGDYDTARRLALQAHNLGAQAEAGGLLRQIDAQVYADKQRTAVKSFDAAADAVRNKDHGHALGVLVLIDPNLLPADARTKREELVRVCKAELDKGDDPKPGVVAAVATQPPATAELQPLPGLGSPTAPGTARVGTPADPKTLNPDSLANQADAMKRVTFQKIRAEGLKVQADAQAAFGRGDTEVAIRMLAEYSNRVRAANLEPASVALLLRPVDSRLEMFRMMRGQTESVVRENKEKAETKLLLANRGAAEEQRKAEVQRLVRQANSLVKEGKYAEAEKLAMQAKQLEPDDPAIGALATLARTTRRVKEAEKLKSDKEIFVLGGLNNADTQGPLVTSDDPVAVQIESSRRARRRGSSDDAYLRTMTPALYEIDLKLEKPITIEFNQTPLSEAVRNVQQLTALPVSWDTAALESEAVSSAKPVSGEYKGLSTRNVLYLLLDNAGLSFVLEYDTVRITTVKKAKGRLFTKVFSVADLVTPIPNFALPDYANFDKMINRNAFNSGKAMIGGLNAPTGGGGPRGGGLGGATLAGTAATSPGIAGGGSLDNNPLSSSSNVVPDRNTKHEQLIKLVTSMVRPHSWDAQGGAGKVEYFDLGSALVVNQTADVISEIQALLEALRRLQDLAVAVEVRIISLSETWFERMGVDFAVNVKTGTTGFEPALVNQTFRPEPFINDINFKGTTVGLTPAGSFTPDLDVPIRATSFNRAIPGFGGFPNNPGNNGGISLGLAFLNDIQVYMFMEASQGDRRVNVMQAPKLTLFNGQTATISINDLQFFVTDVQVFSVNGQIVFIPQNTPLPGPGQGGINLSLQAVVSADRRFVRINIPVTLAVQTGATVPLFPITTFITPVFEGGSQGVPIPFTQFLQQPSFTTLNIQTTVVCPDGGTVLLGGLKTLGEGRNEFGPPFLSKVPYLNRLFKNVGIGRETTHIMIMITPRIIINAEEEINQTEGGPLGTRPGQ